MPHGRTVTLSAPVPALIRSGLVGIGLLAAVVYVWGITVRPVHSYYASAVRSMSLSWRAFVFGGFDPQASISIDKIPGAFWLQALSVRAFGFHDWSVALPSVLEAVLTILVLYKVVDRWFGPVASMTASVSDSRTGWARRPFAWTVTSSPAPLSPLPRLARRCWRLPSLIALEDRRHVTGVMPPGEFRPGQRTTD
jgi:hypothetical protein